MKKFNNLTEILIFFGIIIFIAVGLRLTFITDKKSIAIKIGAANYVFMVAANEETRIRGLSNFDSMGGYEGMYFIFDRLGINKMVMRDMRFPLDMIWLNGNIITDLAENLPPEPGRAESELTIYSNKVPGNGVLEAPAGFIAKHSLKVGDMVEIGTIK